MRFGFHTGSALILLVMAVVAGCERDLASQPAAQAGESDALQSVPSEHHEGFRVYQRKCELCHDRGEEGAPRLGIVRQWAKRAEQGPEVLTQHAFDGFEGMWGEMPAQGDDLSRNEVAAAVGYMLYRFQEAKQNSQ